MKLTRRNFLAWAGLGAVGAVACEGFGIREGELKIQSPALLPEDLVRGKDNWYATLCRSCPSSEGIIVRDVATGLVDFPSQREGREVYLCWIRGEERIDFWHETNRGFAHRQPL